jgi:hypothetical protein
VWGGGGGGGGRGGGGGGGGPGAEMTQTLYAHMNKIKNFFKMEIKQHSSKQPLVQRARQKQMRKWLKMRMKIVY